MTFSIIAYDPETDVWGIAVASRISAIGSYVSYAKWGLGLVASQGLVPNYGDRILDEVLNPLIQEDHLIVDAFDNFLSEDKYHQHRQIAFIDYNGRIINYNGDKLVPFAGSVSDDYVSAQGNMLVNKDTIIAMLETYLADDDNPDFGDRLLNALEAGEGAGGDRRVEKPWYSAALLIVKPLKECKNITSHCKTDLRIDQSSNMTPIQDLRDLYWTQKSETGDITL